MEVKLLGKGHLAVQDKASQKEWKVKDAADLKEVPNNIMKCLWGQLRRGIGMAPNTVKEQWATIEEKKNNKTQFKANALPSVHKCAS